MNGLGESEPDFPSGEPVEGELLADRLARGGIPPEEALRYAIDIGISLKRAHSQGLVHGALSPHAIRIAGAGARVLQPPRGPDAASAPYRSPQQVGGAPADSLDDIFAYGAILYEMASGKRAFPEEGAALDLAIVERPPAALAGKSPTLAAMEGVIAACLQKDRTSRRQRIQNAVAELRLAGSTLARVAEMRRERAPAPSADAVPPVSRPAAPSAGAARRKRPMVDRMYLEPGRLAYADILRRRLAVLGLGLLALAATAVAAVFYFQRQPPAPALRFSVQPPEHTAYSGPPSISPNGRYLVFPAAGPGGTRMLWVQPLDELHPSLIPGTSGADAPFWSPDSEFVAFFANGSLKKVRVGGGPVETICPAGAMAGGGTWSPDGTILFAPGLADGLYRVPAGGGRPRRVSTPNSAKHESAHLWPQFLPDGRHFIFFVLAHGEASSGVYLGSPDQPAGKLLFTSETNAVYAATAGENSLKKGYLLYINGGSAMAQPFDLSRLAVEGDPIALADDIGLVRSLSLAPISVSANAIMAYQPVGPPARQMVWMDRFGREIATASEGGEWGPPRISPDGRRAVVAKAGADGGNADLWILDTGGGATQLTSTPFHEGSPVWSPDGLRVAYFSNQDGAYDIYMKAANLAAKGELAFRSPFPKYPTDWSRDGRYLLFGVLTGGTKSDLWALSIADRRAAPILASIYNEGYAALSPDGNWLAYQSDDSGEDEVYVQAFEHASPGIKRRWQVSQGGGALPRWRADGTEIFYTTASGRMMAATVHPGQTAFSCNAPHMLFRTPSIPKTWNLYDVSPDGQRFLMNLPLECSHTSRITVATNWTAKLKD